MVSIAVSPRGRGTPHSGGGTPRGMGGGMGFSGGRSAQSLIWATIGGFILGAFLSAKIMAVMEGGTMSAGKTATTLGSVAGGRILRRQQEQTDIDTAVVDFEKQPGVVIVTKIHGEHYMEQLKQSFCLLMVAYNNRPRYDMVVFTTEPISDLDAGELRDIVHPARLRIEMDISALGKHLQHSVTEAEREDLLARCNATTPGELHWRQRCSTGGATGIPMPLGYNWQAEFRSKYLWTHPAIADYRYMMWWDSDAMPTRVWDADPVAVAVRNGLKVFFANFPGGTHKTTELRERVFRAYNETLCHIKLQDGHLSPVVGTACEGRHHFIIPQIHGWFHISSLDFYRSEENIRWNDILLGGERFSRKWDDQIQITIPAAMRAPELSWDFESHGVRLDVMHNQRFDGKRKYDGYYVKWWENEATRLFPEAVQVCSPLIKNGG